MTSSRYLVLLTVCCLSAYSDPTEASLHPFEAVEPHMGTLFRIKLYAQNESQAQAAFHTAFERIGQLDGTLSDYQPNSELNRVTRSPVRQPVHVSKDLFRVLSAAQNMAEETDGAFDVTVGPLTHLWRAARKQGNAPSTKALGTALEQCGFRKMHLDAGRQSVMFDIDGMQLDLGGIAKGYAADEAIAVLRGAGVSRALVAASGDLAFSDAPPGKGGWSIGVDALDSAGQPFTRVLVMTNAAVSTSGDTEQHLDVGGKRYSHIIDPKTGMGLTNQLTITVAARNGTEADAAATAISVLGRDKGLVFVEGREGMAALLVDRSDHPAVVTISRRFELLRSLD